MFLINDQAGDERNNETYRDKKNQDFLPYP